MPLCCNCRFPVALLKYICHQITASPLPFNISLLSFRTSPPPFNACSCLLMPLRRPLAHLRHLLTLFHRSLALFFSPLTPLLRHPTVFRRPLAPLHSSTSLFNPLHHNDALKHAQYTDIEAEGIICTSFISTQQFTTTTTTTTNSYPSPFNADPHCPLTPLYRSVTPFLALQCLSIALSTPSNRPLAPSQHPLWSLNISTLPHKANLLPFNASPSTFYAFLLPFSAS